MAREGGLRQRAGSGASPLGQNLKLHRNQLSEIPTRYPPGSALDTNDLPLTFAEALFLTFRPCLAGVFISPFVSERQTARYLLFLLLGNLLTVQQPLRRLTDTNLRPSHIGVPSTPAHSALPSLPSLSTLHTPNPFLFLHPLESFPRRPWDTRSTSAVHTLLTDPGRATLAVQHREFSRQRQAPTPRL